MNINGRKATANEIAKMEIINKLELAFYDGVKHSDNTATMYNDLTDKQAEQIQDQANKRYNSIMKYLGGYELMKKFYS